MVCLRRKRSQSIPKVAIPRVTDFNQTIACDLKEINDKYILWIVDTFTRFIKGVVLKNKEAPTVLKAVVKHWCENFGYPSECIFQDNGNEFANKDMRCLASRMNLRLKFTPNYSPWSNGINERNHYSADLTVRKLLDDKGITLEDSVSTASWCHNTNVNKKGFLPLQLVTGKAITIPGITEGNIATESPIHESEALRNHIEIVRNAAHNDRFYN